LFKNCRSLERKIKRCENPENFAEEGKYHNNVIKLIQIMLSNITL